MQAPPEPQGGSHLPTHSTLHPMEVRLSSLKCVKEQMPLLLKNHRWLPLPSPYLSLLPTIPPLPSMSQACSMPSLGLDAPGFPFLFPCDLGCVTCSLNSCPPLSMGRFNYLSL